MEMNRDAPVQAVAEIDINAPLELVWNVQADLNGWPKWNPDIKSIELKGPMAPGTSFKWKAGGMTIVSQLETMDPPREIGWTGRAFGLKAVHVWHFLPNESGGTRVLTEESFEGAFARLFRTRLRRTLQSTLERSARALKKESERRAALGGI